MRARRIVSFSAYSTNLRAAAVARLLRESGYEIVAPRPRGRPGSIGELVRTLIPNCWTALTCRADLAVGWKPHLNVTLPLLICQLRGIPTWIDVDDLDHAYRDGFLGRDVCPSGVYAHWKEQGHVALRSHGGEPDRSGLRYSNHQDEGRGSSLGDLHLVCGGRR